MIASDRKARKPRKSAIARPLKMMLQPRLPDHKINAREVLRNLNDAVRKADRLKKTIRMTVVIDPRRPRVAIATEATESPAASDSILQAARERGSARIADILNSEDMLSADAFASEIGATRETVNNKRKRHEILGLEGPKRGIRFPKWQLSRSGELLPRLPELFDALGGHPWAVYRFLLMKHPELGGKRGLDALRGGSASDVIDAAKAIGSGSFA